MLVIKLTKLTENGSLIMTLKVPRNPVMDFMEQANLAAKPYLSSGWHLSHASIE